MKFYDNYSLENIKYIRPDGVEGIERWKQIEDFEFYHVSNLGRLKSLSRLIIRKCGKNFVSKEKILKPNVDKDGYHEVTLRKNNSSYRRKRHRLVAQHFLLNPNNLPEVNHLRDENEIIDKGNNCYWLMEWSTGLDNIRHAYANGLLPVGEKCVNAKLTEADVLAIRENKDNVTHRELGEIYGVNRGTITKILNGSRWKHLL